MDYKKCEKLRYDKQQTILTKKGCKINPHHYAEKELNLKWNNIITCPFCLNHNYLYDFRKISGFFECPFCKSRMRNTSLIVNMDIAKFARWVYGYRLNGFWQKVFPDFNAWNKKLRELDISYDFWENYKRLKGVSDSESEQDE